MSETTLDDIARRIDHIEADLSQLKEAMQAGLKDSEILREDLHRRFDASERKHFEQISLLKAVIRSNLTNR
jgi:hypothetical protein